MRFLDKKWVKILIVLFIIWSIRHIYDQSQIHWVSDVSYVDISDICRTKYITDSSLITIYEQTGVSMGVARELIISGDISSLLNLNKMYLRNPKIKQSYIAFPFTTIERNKSFSVPIAQIKDGDIIINFSTSTLDWRHGHSAIVIDAEKDKTIEHTMVGGKSSEGSVSSWSRQPAFVILRYEDETVVKRVVEFAKDNLLGLDYDIFVGIDGKKDKCDNRKYASNCSHIVWQSFKSQGIDIDSNGGLFVTPKDIAMSDKLKVVQIYGINTKDYEDRILK